jgi:hypothetical protein
MKLVTCPKCQSQFDVASMAAGSTFVCGKCRNVMQVPAAPPVMQPIGAPPAAAPVVPQQVRAPQPAPPPTVALTPEQMKAALASAKAPAPAPGGARPGPKLPAAMEARRQTAAPTRAGAVPPPNTVVVSPEEMKKALAASKSVGDEKKQAAAAKAAAAKPAAPRRTRAAAAAEASAAAAPPAKKPPVALYAGVGGLVVVGAIAWLALSGKDDDASKTGPAGAPGATASAAPAAPAVTGDPKKDLVALPDAERANYINKQFEAAQKEPDPVARSAKLKDIYGWSGDATLGQLPGVKAASQQALDTALLADPNTTWAREAKGDVAILEMLKSVKAECPTAFADPEEHEKRVNEMVAKYEKEPWVTRAVFVEAEKCIDKVREREKMLAGNPRAAIAARKHAWALEHPGFKGLHWLKKFDDPYVVSQQYDVFTDEADKHKNAEREKKANWVAATDALMFRKTYENWLVLFGDRFKMPRLETTNRVLHAIITWNRASFEDLYRRDNPGSEISGGIRAFYSPMEQRIFHYLGDEAMRSQDEIPCKGGRVQKGAYQVAAHEETHQLQHEYTFIHQGHPLEDGKLMVRQPGPMWFTEGLAEFMGACEVADSEKEDLANAKVYFNVILLDRVAGVRGFGQNDNLREQAREWTLERMMAPTHHAELEQASEKLLPGQKLVMVNLFYARAWGLAHFLWYYDNGKYRENFLKYMELVLKDQASPQGFARIMGRKDIKDWGDVEKEYEWYWNELLKRRIGWKDKGRTQHWDTVTTPPEGRWEPPKEEDE